MDFFHSCFSSSQNSLSLAKYKSSSWRFGMYCSRGGGSGMLVPSQLCSIAIRVFTPLRIKEQAWQKFFLPISVVCFQVTLPQKNDHTPPPPCHLLFLHLSPSLCQATPTSLEPANLLGEPLRRTPYPSISHFKAIRDGF